MASGGTEAFPDLGRHCAEETCHQLDFLPFECDSCKKTFCLEHRSYKAHACPKVEMKDNVVLICPECTATVRKVFGEKPELTLKKHSETGGCKPASVKKPLKCPVKGCRELLTFSNTYKCKTCRKDTCLKHRYPSAHICVENKRNALFLEALAKRGVADCGSESVSSKGSSVTKKIEGILGALRLGKAH